MEKEINKLRVRDFNIVASFPLEEEVVRELLGHLNDKPGKTRSVLGGRVCVTPANLGGIGPVVIKHYSRGGLFGHLISNQYVRWGRSRSQREFEVMQQARAVGVSVPEPVAYIDQGKFLYRAWLVSREVKEHKTLAELSVENQDLASSLMGEVTKQISKLVQKRICHIDLHPGNVLVGEHNKIYLVDFDKSRESVGDRNELRDKYLCRWRRAVIKHKLPEFLSEMLCAGLRTNFEHNG